MTQPYFEVTYRRGAPLAAYYYLPRRAGQKSHRTEEAAPGLLVDYARDGKPIGIEILDPEKLTLAKMNRVLRALGQPVLARADLAPLRVAESQVDSAIERSPQFLSRIAEARAALRHPKGVKLEDIKDKRPRR